MAAYAALASLMNLLEQLQRHPQPPITLHTNQLQTLTQKIAFLQDFLEVYNSHYSKPEMEHLRNHIADAAYAAEDVIETLIINWIRVRSAIYDDEVITSLRNLFVKVEDLQRQTAIATPICDEENICSIGLHEVIRDMGFVEKEVLEIKDTLGAQDPQRFITTDVVASKSTSTEHNIVVGFDDVLEEMLDKLTGQPDSHRQIIPISGMGGIGKTTLARKVYIHRLTEEYFDICAWTTISQGYNIRDILLGVLLGQKNEGSRESRSQMSEAEVGRVLDEKKEGSQDSMRQMSEAKLGEMLYKRLCGRRYLIVMDDMWSHEAWDGVKRFFPNECNGSRIIVTTRLTILASYLTTIRGGIEVDFLDQDKSWRLFCKTVFGEENGCPSELEHVGKEISRNCKGLPLSIVVLGGLLAKSKRTHVYWEYIAENLNSIVNLEENERCLKILRTSYDQLPAHLKACFLYMGVFPEDHEIHESELIQMWVAEGFFNPINGKGLEESAEEYLMDLVGRNLIMVHEDKFSWGKKVFNIHDLLRDLCIREAQKESFICVANQHSEGLNTQRRVAIHQDTSGKERDDGLKGGSTTRSLMCSSRDVVLPSAELRLLRVFRRFHPINQKDMGNYIMEDIFRLVNLRYLFLSYNVQLRFHTSLSQLWNLQTLYISGACHVVAPLEIWKLPLIRHIQTNDSLILPDPTSGHTDGRDEFVLHELRTLEGVSNLKVGEEVIKRIPNVTKLELTYNLNYKLRTVAAINIAKFGEKVIKRIPNVTKLGLNFDTKIYEGPIDINNLNRLHKLEEFSIFIYPASRTELLQNFTFPHSLKKLSLYGTNLHWEDISTKIGSLPRLQMLRLDSLKGPEWETVEGQFCSLKYLKIELCDLKCWSTENTHFPCLEYLHLSDLRNLEEIPLCIGDIPTLKSIRVEYCSNSAVMSAKRIFDEQEELGNLSLRIRIQLAYWNDKSLEELATHNFQIVF